MPLLLYCSGHSLQANRTAFCLDFQQTARAMLMCVCVCVCVCVWVRVCVQRLARASAPSTAHRHTHTHTHTPTAMPNDGLMAVRVSEGAGWDGGQIKRAGSGFTQLNRKR